MKLLIEHGADVDCTDDLGRTPLHLASEVGRPRAIQLLLEYGADVNKRMHRGRTPLHLSICSGDVEVVRLLLQHGANVNDENDDWTALHGAAHPWGGSLEITRVLLEYGANVHARAKSNKTPLELWSNGGDHDIAQLLSKHVR